MIYVISIVNWIFGHFILKIFLCFFTDFISLMFHNNFVKISDNFECMELIENLHQNYPPYQFVHNFAAIFTTGKKYKDIQFFNPYPAVHDNPYLCKKCSSRLDGF